MCRTTKQATKNILKLKLMGKTNVLPTYIEIGLLKYKNPVIRNLSQV